MKRGFTLIELVAVIIILAIVALVVTPITLNVIEEARKSASYSELYQIIDAAKLYYADSLLNIEKQGDIDNNRNIIDKLVMSNPIRGEGYVYVNKDGEVELAILKDKKCYVKDYNSGLYEYSDINNCVVPYDDSVLKGADPVLDEGMIPVNIDSNGNLTKADIRTKWYDYTTKKWANMVLVNEESRESYINALPETEVKKEDVLAYYVWIPRYKYQIFTQVDDSIKFDEDYNLNKSQLIKIEFEDKYTSKSKGINKDEWLTHPAFTFGSNEVNGIWVGKFETTGTIDNPTILPNTTSITGENASTYFISSLKFAGNSLLEDGRVTHDENNTYGINNTDSHMIKNSEWGAVAYLTNSQYGRCIKNAAGVYTCEEIRINNSMTYTTGCAATVVPTVELGDYKEQTDHTEGYYNGCENAYNDSIGVLASTTGNITGIYDMSGGAWDYTMAVMEDALDSGVPFSGRNSDLNSGFTGLLSVVGSDLIAEVNGVSFPESKYYDLYQYTQDTQNYIIGKFGDATVELGSFSIRDGASQYSSNWNYDRASFIYNSSPWVIRGGRISDGAAAGIFAFGSETGGPGSQGRTFRTVLVNN